MIIEPLSSFDEILPLLTDCNLPVADILASSPRFFGVRVYGILLAVVGLKIYQSAALLRSLAVVLFVTSMAAFADQSGCDRVSKQAEDKQAFFSPAGGYKVIGEGRLYFHSAPDKSCRTKDVFVVPGDELIAYLEYKGWYFVMYTNPKTGNDYEAWVDSKRLKFIGTMGQKN